MAKESSRKDVADGGGIPQFSPSLSAEVAHDARVNAPPGLVTFASEGRLAGPQGAEAVYLHEGIDRRVHPDPARLRKQ